MMDLMNRWQDRDDNLEVDGQDLKAVYASQVRAREALENAPLKTKSMRDKEQAERRKKYPEVWLSQYLLD